MKDCPWFFILTKIIWGRIGLFNYKLPPSGIFYNYVYIPLKGYLLSEFFVRKFIDLFPHQLDPIFRINKRYTNITPVIPFKDRAPRILIQVLYIILNKGLSIVSQIGSRIEKVWMWCTKGTWKAVPDTLFWLNFWPKSFEHRSLMFYSVNPNMNALNICSTNAMSMNIDFRYTTMHKII